MPALKPVCGNSISATLLMAQLEYWFASHSQGFYKFLAPCQHSRYRPGDSWTEELNFTSREFRTGFDKIGVRYKSKKYLFSVIEANKDPFQGQYYLSYIDVRSGLTIYCRSHERVDPLLTELFNDYQPTQAPIAKQSIVYSGDSDSVFPEITNPNFEKCGYVISGNAKLSSPIKDTKINNRENTKNTAAVSIKFNRVLPSDSSKESIVAAVKNKEERVVMIDNRIGETLTSTQQACLRRLLPNLSTYFPKIDLARLETAITHTLCDPESFNRAGQDFFKKLNTLQKAIRSGNWQMPADVDDKKIKTVVNHRGDLERQWRELHGEHQQLKSMIDSMNKQGKLGVQEKIQKQVRSCQDRMMLVEEKLQELAAQHPSEM